MAVGGSSLLKLGSALGCTLILYFCFLFPLVLFTWTQAVQDVNTRGLNESGSLSSLCHNQCPGVLIKEGFIQQQCSNSSDTSVKGRCCMEKRCAMVKHEVENCSKVVIGLDWSHCNLTLLSNYTFEAVGSTLHWLDVSGNELNNKSVASRAFGALVNLTHLVLPEDMDCAVSIWDSISSTEHGNLCTHPIWPCGWPALYPANGHETPNTTGNTTEFCPESSYCVDDGPGLHQCVCQPGYYGYKCLLKGYFPYVTFFTSTVSGTLVIIGLNWTLRLIHRYYVRTYNYTR